MSTLSNQTMAKRKQRNPLANRSFRLMWLGESVSLIGDQFYVIALPWLVLQMTGSLLAVGTILFIGGIPRTIFMLVGGVLVDRSSPRTIMLVSNLARLAITMVLVLLVITQSVQLWMLYVISFGDYPLTTRSVVLYYDYMINRRQRGITWMSGYFFWLILLMWTHQTSLI